MQEETMFNNWIPKFESKANKFPLLEKLSEKLAKLKKYGVIIPAALLTACNAPSSETAQKFDTQDISIDNQQNSIIESRVTDLFIAQKGLEQTLMDNKNAAAEVQDSIAPDGRKISDSHYTYISNTSGVPNKFDWHYISITPKDGTLANEKIIAVNIEKGLDDSQTSFMVNFNPSTEKINEFSRIESTDNNNGQDFQMRIYSDVKDNNFSMVMGSSEHGRDSVSPDLQKKYFQEDIQDMRNIIMNESINSK